MSKSSVLNMSTHSSRMFFGEEGQGICRYDEVRHPIFKAMNTKLRNLYWAPEEVDLSQDRASFAKMSDAEQFVFTSNLQRQILLDSVQGRSPGLVFLPHCTDSSLENCLITWAFFESLHSESYTHVIRAIYSDPSKVFDEIPSIKPIVECSDSVTVAYDNMRENPNKENLYLALISANALEALRFYVSFACTFSFAERGLVEGSAKEVKLIARDETQHLALVSHILKRLPKDDPEFVQIIGDLRPQAIKIFDDTAQQEREWAHYLFQHGNIMGLNEKILVDYVDYLLPRRKSGAFLTTTAKFESQDPLPWMKPWLIDSSSQLPPQEVESTAYLTSSLKNDSSELEFNFEL